MINYREEERTVVEIGDCLAEISQHSRFYSGAKYVSIAFDCENNDVV